MEKTKSDLKKLKTLEEKSIAAFEALKQAFSEQSPKSIDNVKEKYTCYKPHKYFSHNLNQNRIKLTDGLCDSHLLRYAIGTKALETLEIIIKCWSKVKNTTLKEQTLNYAVINKHKSYGGIQGIIYDLVMAKKYNDVINVLNQLNGKYSLSQSELLNFLALHDGLGPEYHQIEHGNLLTEITYQINSVVGEKVDRVYREVRAKNEGNYISADLIAIHKEKVFLIEAKSHLSKRLQKLANNPIREQLIPYSFYLKNRFNIQPELIAVYHKGNSSKLTVDYFSPQVV